jgi:uncharacterized protein YcbX
MLQVSQLYVYPIKSLGGVSLKSADLTDRGFQYDRRWMLVDGNNRFLTQREINEMALLQVEILNDGLHISHKQNHSNYFIPFLKTTGKKVTVDIWGTQCDAQLVDQDADDWFTRILNVRCKLVYMPDTTKVFVEKSHAINEDLTSFSDGYPILMISEASLNDLNDRLPESLPINRFRPNLVFSGGSAFEEDTMKEFLINDQTFYGVKPSARCIITTIDQDTAVKNKEPLKTLSTYRSKNNKIHFGENVITGDKGKINIGDTITVLQSKESLFQ